MKVDPNTHYFVEENKGLYNSLSSCYLAITKIGSLNRWVIFVNSHTAQRWAFSFLSGGFSIPNLVNSADRNLVNSTSVHWDTDNIDVGFLEGYLNFFQDNKLLVALPIIHVRFWYGPHGGLILDYEQQTYRKRQPPPYLVGLCLFCLFPLL